MVSPTWSIRCSGNDTECIAGEEGFCQMGPLDTALGPQGTQDLNEGLLLWSDFRESGC